MGEGTENGREEVRTEVILSMRDSPASSLHTVLPMKNASQAPPQVQGLAPFSRREAASPGADWGCPWPLAYPSLCPRRCSAPLPTPFLTICLLFSTRWIPRIPKKEPKPS